MNSTGQTVHGTALPARFDFQAANLMDTLFRYPTFMRY